VLIFFAVLYSNKTFATCAHSHSSARRVHGPMKAALTRFGTVVVASVVTMSLVGLVTSPEKRTNYDEGHIKLGLDKHFLYF
jgi:hypothetical protein